MYIYVYSVGVGHVADDVSMVGAWCMINRDGNAPHICEIGGSLLSGGAANVIDVVPVAVRHHAGAVACRHRNRGSLFQAGRLWS